MNTSRFVRPGAPLTLIPGVVLTLIMLLALSRWAGAYTGDIPAASDVNGDPNIFETTLTVDEVMVDLESDATLSEMLGVNGTVPGPEIRVQVGDRVIVHVQNHAEVPIMIHWHGIELNNYSDGTPVTQDEICTAAVAPCPPGGGTYTYDFIVTRAGVFWYHPHLAPTDQVFRGFYGPLIVEDPAETILENLGILPSVDKTLVLSETTRCKDVDGSDTAALQAACAVLNPEDIPDVQPPFNCGGGGGACRVNEGKLILSNGRTVIGTDFLNVTAGEGVRLRIINAAITRYFRLVPPPGHQLFRVGGEGGLLDNVRLEGGNLSALPANIDTGYALGEIVLGPADREDIIIVPTGAVNDELEIQSEDAGNIFSRGNATNPGQTVAPVVRLRINATGGSFSIASGDPLLTHASVNAPIEDMNLIPGADLDALLDPRLIPNQRGDLEPTPGSAKHNIELQNAVMDGGSIGPAIDGVRGEFDETGPGGFTSIEHIGSSRFAFTGAELELSVTNTTGSHHPFHLHGFSFQPIRLEDGSGNTFTYDFREFVDNINIANGHTLTFRVRLEDRPLFGQPPGSGGGAAGRWVFHCHIFHHAGLGMISELVVLPSSPMDVFLLADQTGSFQDDFAAFKLEASGIVASLLDIAPEVRMALATFKDFPMAPFGSPTDFPYQLMINFPDFDLSMPGDAVQFVNAINGLPIPSGGADLPESQLFALKQAATPPPTILAGSTTNDPGGSFNANTPKVFLLWTDAAFHLPTDGGGTYPGPSVAATLATVLALDPPKVLGIASGGGGRADLEAMATLTGALAPANGVDCNGDMRIASGVDILPGQPLVCDVPANGVGVGIAIDRLLRAVQTISTPNANCNGQGVTVPNDPGRCDADSRKTSVDAGSSDPDEDPLKFFQTPAAPYAVGTTPVSLLVQDSTGLRDVCASTVTVQDGEIPAVGCNAPATVHKEGVPYRFTATASDNCDATATVAGFDCSGCTATTSGDSIFISEVGAVGSQIFWLVRAVDESSNTSTEQCSVDVVADACSGRGGDSDNDGICDDVDNCKGTPNRGQEDGDKDGVGDVCDNCIQASNTNQRDTDDDGFGNRCDPDLNNDNIVNVLDIGLFKRVFFTDDPDADLNGDGTVNVLDIGLFKPFFGGPPGPSASPR